MERGIHLPVMVEEVLENLIGHKGGTYIDATTGPGGHSEAILASLWPEGRLFCLDRDAESLELAARRLQEDVTSGRCVIRKSTFSGMAEAIGPEARANGVDGVLMDFGISMHQLRSMARGFGFDSDEALDMRMDRTQPVSAADIVNSTPEGELADIIYNFGQERKSRRIAAAIVRARGRGRIGTCRELAGIVASAMGRGWSRTHPATRVFQALRIAVNAELDEVAEGLGTACGLLNTGGRVVAISYHSLEDGLVKHYFKDMKKEGVLNVLTKKPLRPTEAELAMNPSARSARLRAAERC